MVGCCRPRPTDFCRAPFPFLSNWKGFRVNQLTEIQALEKLAENLRGNFMTYSLVSRLTELICRNAKALSVMSLFLWRSRWSKRKVTHPYPLRTLDGVLAITQSAVGCLYAATVNLHNHTALELWAFVESYLGWEHRVACFPVKWLVFPGKWGHSLDHHHHRQVFLLFGNITLASFCSRSGSASVSKVIQKEQGAIRAVINVNSSLAAAQNRFSPYIRWNSRYFPVSKH